MRIDRKNGTAKQTDIILLHFITNAQWKNQWHYRPTYAETYDSGRRFIDEKPNQQYKQ